MHDIQYKLQLKQYIINLKKQYFAFIIIHNKLELLT